jgi:predicted HicB family RNase H-like nuclease
MKKMIREKACLPPGKLFNLRISSELHEKLAIAAVVYGKSLYTLAQEVLQRSVTA